MVNDRRVILTKRLLREGLLRCLKNTPIEKITIHRLCEESGVNRTTFYKHYQTPIQVLYEITCEYADQLQSIYEECIKSTPGAYTRAAEACCEYLYSKKAEIKVLFSENTGMYIEKAAVDIMEWMIKAGSGRNADTDELRLFICTGSMAIYGLIKCWLTEDIQRTPHDIVMIMDRYFGVNTYYSAFEEFSRK
ncbi:MAG: TetR/AcrR family transcriptional regulator [Clostridia bacterium]|nr:TetR/AcrR family transcriptional regulator [Clostridia bacterium]